MRRRILAVVILTALTVSFGGCAAEPGNGGANTEAGEQQKDVEGKVVKSEAESHLKDNDVLYEEDDDTSVVTMYLTVSKGNPSENTNHTWQEINSHSAYYYQELGIDRYAVNGLLQVGDENGPVLGELGYGKYVPNATVTIRGQTSSNNAQKNYKIELKDGSGTWRDQRVINLNKHQTDGVRFRNKLSYDLLEELPGLVAMQTQFVHLYVKDETEGVGEGFVDYGLYTQVEQPNKSFLKRHGFDKNGHLYKINFFEFYRYEDILMLKSDGDYDEKRFEELLEIKGNDDHSKLIAMLEDVNDSSMDIEDVLEKWFDTDNMVSWMAFQILTGNIDTQSRNTLLYSPLNSNTWYFISWDCDAAFRLTEDELIGRDITAGWEQGISNYWGNVLFSRALKSSSFREKLDQKIEEYRSILTEEKLSAMVNSYAQVVKPYAFGQTDKFYEPLTEEKYDAVCSGIPSEVQQNYEAYRESLTKPMPFFIGTPSREQTGLLFQWENSFDFSNENIFYTFELADNLEFADPIVVQENIFVPEYQYTGDLAPGQYFIRVKAKNESQKEQYAFDYYVSDGVNKNYGILCFYINQDGSIGVETYEEN